LATKGLAHSALGTGVRMVGVTQSESVEICFWPAVIIGGDRSAKFYRVFVRGMGHVLVVKFDLNMTFITG